MPSGQRLELIVALARQVNLRIAVRGQVEGRDAHAPDLCPNPTVGIRVSARRLARFDPPQLFLAVDVVLAIVAQSEVAATGAIPVAEQHRQGAVARLEDQGSRPSRPVGGRPDELVRGAVARRRAIWFESQVVPQGERWTRHRAFPRRAERGRPLVATVEAPGLVRPLERTATESPEQHVLTHTQDREIGVAIAVDVKRVRPGHPSEVCGSTWEPLERELTADRAVVPVEGRWVAPAGEVELGLAVAIAVERGDATAGVERRPAVIDVSEARIGGLVHERRRA